MNDVHGWRGGERRGEEWDEVGGRMGRSTALEQSVRRKEEGRKEEDDQRGTNETGHGHEDQSIN